MQGDGPGTLTSMHLPNPSEEVIRYIAKPAETRTGVELILDYIIEFLDYQTFIHCHKVLSKTVKTAGIGEKAERYAAQLQCYAQPWREALKEAATHAKLTISSEPWTVRNPRCCSERCPYSRKTGLWLPASEMVSQQNLWWRNLMTENAWNLVTEEWAENLTEKRPQEEIDEFFGYRPFGPIPGEVDRIDKSGKKWYVVCSELCFIRVKVALETIKLYTKQNFGIVIGVEEYDDRSIRNSRSRSRSPRAVELETRGRVWIRRPVGEYVSDDETLRFISFERVRRLIVREVGLRTQDADNGRREGGPLVP